MSKDVKPVKVEGTVMWAFLNKRNDYSNSYQVDICNLSVEDTAKLEGLGIDVKERDDKPEKGRFITCKSKNFEIKAYDVNGDEIDAVIGNGSKCRAIIGTYEWKWKANAGVSPSLKKLVITDLVKYEAPEEQEEY